MSVHKFVALLQYPIAAVVIAFWLSAEDETNSLREQLDEERRRRRRQERLAEEAHAARVRLEALVDEIDGRRRAEEDPVYIAAHSVVDQWRGVASSWDGALATLEKALGRKAPLPPEHATSVMVHEGDPLHALLFCPFCGAQHVDRGEFATRRHHKHLCAACGRLWRVEPYAVGVEALSGRASLDAHTILHAEVAPVLLGDTEEENAEAQRWAERYAPIPPEFLARHAADHCEEDPPKLRALASRFRDRAAALVARAAELDQAQGRGSWARPRQSVTAPLELKNPACVICGKRGHRCAYVPAQHEARQGARVLDSAGSQVLAETITCHLCGYTGCMAEHLCPRRMS